MRMRSPRSAHLLLPMLLVAQAAATEPSWTWPIRGALRGSDVILSPTSTIRNVYRDVDEPFGGYVIGVPEGSEVVAVADGTIVFCQYCYHPDYLTSYGDSAYDAIAAEISARDPKALRWLGLDVGITLDSGLVVWYCGLRAPPTHSLGTGQRVSRGEILGHSAYSYRGVSRPSIAVSCSRAGRRVDPSPWLVGECGPAPRGTDSAALNYRTLRHPEAELRASLRVAWQALLEAHPALFAYVERDVLQCAFEDAEAAIDRPLTSDEFFRIVQPVVARIRDNHCYVERSYAQGLAEQYTPQCFLHARIGFFADGCFLLRPGADGRTEPARVVLIGGEPVNELRTRLAGYAGSGDGSIETWVASRLTDIGSLYLLDKGSPPGEEVVLQLENGSAERIVVETAPVTTAPTAVPLIETRTLEGGIAYLRVRAMCLTDVDRTDLARFFDATSAAAPEGFILDLRNNMGGEVRDSYEIYSYFAREPLRPEVERRVRSVSGYGFAALTENVVPGESPYAAYVPAADGAGYILTVAEAPEAFPTIAPRPTGHYDGEVYVLTNGRTGSAAVVLASLFRRQGRGVLIGEEGANGYHAMSGLDFARLRLGETGLILSIPLVRSVFAPEEGETLAGRGLMPDYPVTYTAADVASGRDIELELALRLARKPAAST